MPTISDLVSILAGKIVQYEDGDILLQSDWIQDLSGLLESLTNEPRCQTLVTDLIGLVQKNMREGPVDHFIEDLSAGIDLVQNLALATSSQQKKFWDSKAEEFLRKNQPEPVDPRSEQNNPVNVEHLKTFIADSEERIARAQEIILSIEKDFSNAELVTELFRVFHTIKGECGFLKIATLGELAHNIENLLDLLRSRKLEPSPIVIDLLLEGIDHSRLILEELQNGQVVVFTASNLDKYVDQINRVASQARANIGDLLVEEGKIDEQDRQSILQLQKHGAYTKKFGEIAVDTEQISAGDLAEVLQKQQVGLPVVETDLKKTSKKDQIIKVKASKVNGLVDMIGELIITIGQFHDQSPLFSQVKKITKGLQHAALELRTDSVKTLFGELKRVVRDLSKSLGKQVEFETLGEDLEIDRNLIEKLEEPLVHVIRNSLDHGIEAESERVAKGKSAQGRLVISAERKGNLIEISVHDDGRGLDREKIAAKAIEMNLIKPEAAAHLSDSEIFGLIFVNGFSTAEKVGYISGRGVGMDVVRSVVSSFRGKIEIETDQDRFTRFRFLFPLSTAIIDGVVVRLGTRLFVVPIVSVLETIKLDLRKIVTVNGGIRIIDLRGEAIPIISLVRVFAYTDFEDDQENAVVVENSDKKKFVLPVDEILSKKEIVIKSLGQKFKQLRGISSGTVLPGGGIGLVFDVDEIVKLSQEQGVS